MSSKHPILDRPGALWRSAPPWSARPADTAGQAARTVSRVVPILMLAGPKSEGESLRTMAKGWRPYKAQNYQRAEKQATLFAGMATLAAASISPWSSLTFDDVPPLKLTNNDAGLALIAKFNSVMRLPRPATLDTATEHIRKAVSDAKLANPAWFYRAALLASLAQQNQAKRATIEGAIASALGTAATALSATGIGAVVGAPLALAAGGVGAKSASTKMANTRSTGETQEYIQRYEQELQAATGRAQLRQAELQLQQEAARIQQISATEQRETQTEAQQQANMLLWGATGVLTVGSAGMLYYLWRTRSKE
jgi:hypothetical protein